MLSITKAQALYVTVAFAVLIGAAVLFRSPATPESIRAELIGATDTEKRLELSKANRAEEEARAKLAKAEDIDVRMAQLEQESDALRSDAAKAYSWSKSCRNANVLGTVDPAVDCSVIPSVTQDTLSASGSSESGSINSESCHVFAAPLPKHCLQSTPETEDTIKELLGAESKEPKELVEEFDNTDSELNEIAAKYNWRYNAAGKSQAPVGLTASGSGARAAELLGAYGFDSRFGLTKGYGWELFKKVGARYKVKPEFLVCVAKADTSLGKALKSGFNIGNVGNNDRGNVVHLPSIGAGIDHIGLTLTNKWLGYKQSVGSLTPAGGGSAPFYASSPNGNWYNNVRNCLAEIHEDPTVNADWAFRS